MKATFDVENPEKRAVIDGKFLRGEIFTSVNEKEVMVKCAAPWLEYNEETHINPYFFEGKEGQIFDFSVSGTELKVRAKFLYRITNTIDEMEYNSLYFEIL